MKARRVGFAIVAAALLIPFPSAQAATPRPLVAKVERVSDGDTITAITLEETKHRLRLLGNEAPQVSHAKRLN
jgi:endonuclease YncB( thermonuclease family)